MRLPAQYRGYPRALRIGIGLVYLAATVMVAFALWRFVALIMPRYGGRFGYVVFLFGGVACWTAFRGVQLLLGRAGERGPQA